MIICTNLGTYGMKRMKSCINFINDFLILSIKISQFNPKTIQILLNVIQYLVLSKDYDEFPAEVEGEEDNEMQEDETIENYEDRVLNKRAAQLHRYVLFSHHIMHSLTHSHSYFLFFFTFSLPLFL